MSSATVQLMDDDNFEDVDVDATEEAPAKRRSGKGKGKEKVKRRSTGGSSSRHSKEHIESSDSSDHGAKKNRRSKRRSSVESGPVSPPGSTSVIPKLPAALKYALSDIELNILGTQEKTILLTDILFINQFNNHQERLFVLTTRNVYRVKYNFKKKKAEHYQRVDVCDIDMIHKGEIKVEGAKGKLTAKKTKGGSNMYGFRIFAGDERDTDPKSKEQYARTYAILDPSGSGKSEVNELLSQIAAARAYRTSQAIPISDLDIVVKDAKPLLSGAYNVLGLGKAKK